LEIASHAANVGDMNLPVLSIPLDISVGLGGAKAASKDVGSEAKDRALALEPQRFESAEVRAKHTRLCLSSTTCHLFFGLALSNLATQDG